MKIKLSNKKIWSYRIFYICAFTILTIIALFSNSFFAYKFFNSLFFDILYLVFTIAVFVVLSIQNYFKQTTIFGKSFSIIYFNLFSFIFAVRPFVNNRIWAILLFCGFFIGMVLLMVLAFKSRDGQDRYSFDKYCPIVAIVPALLLLMIAASQNYVGSQGMWMPIVFGGIIFAGISLFVFIKFFKSLDYFQKNHRSEFVFAVILIIVAAFMFSGMTVTSANYAFDDNPTIVQAEIIDKNIVNGARQPTTFNLKVNIEGKNKTIEVPVDVYHSKKIGDAIEINLYKGALGYGYYIYER